MSCLYKQPKSPFWWWAARYKGRLFRKSTKMTKRSLAKKVSDNWDLKLMLDDLNFLGRGNHSPRNVTEFISQYLVFVSTRKDENTLDISKGVLVRFSSFLKKEKVNYLDEITVKVVDRFLDSLEVSPKTKKNYLGIISIMLDQAMKEGVINANPARNATLPRIVPVRVHRLLTPADLEIIFSNPGPWLLYYDFLYHTGLRAGDVAMLKYSNIDFKKKAITSFIRKSRRVHEFPLADALVRMISKDKPGNVAIFPDLYEESEKKLNSRIAKPRKYLQALLKANGRPKANLHSFRVTFNNSLRDLGLSIEDRQVLLAHASSQTTKIYTHPNFELASQYVNRLPRFDEILKN